MRSLELVGPALALPESFSGLSFLWKVARSYSSLGPGSLLTQVSLMSFEPSLLSDIQVRCFLG